MSWLDDYLSEAVAERLADVQAPASESYVPVLTARKYGFTIAVPNDLLMDVGAIPDTRTPRKPPTRRERFRWWRSGLRERFAVWAYERISRDEFPDLRDY